MKNYRLKKEAVPFFKEKLATQIHALDVWESCHVDPKALEEVSQVFLTFGVPLGSQKEYKSSSLSGWSKDNGQQFHFTINYPSVKFSETDKFSNGKIVRELMDKIQKQIDYFYQDFVNESDNTES